MVQTWRPRSSKEGQIDTGSLLCEMLLSFDEIIQETVAQTTQRALHVEVIDV